MSVPKLLFTSIVFCVTIHLHAQIVYPVSKMSNQEDDYFGTKVSDPYRWLEDDNANDTKSWVEEQNKVTQDYLSKIPFRNEVKKRLEELWNYPRYSSPFKKGEYYYFYKNNGLQNQSILNRQKGLNGDSKVFINPNEFSKDGTVSLDGVEFSKDAKYCVYLVSQSGSDWEEARIMDVSAKKTLPDKLEWIKFSYISWKGNEGFYYSRYPKPAENDKLKGKNQFHTVYYHKVGTNQSEDQLIYQDKEHPLSYVWAELTDDERFLYFKIPLSNRFSGSEIWVKDLESKEDAPSLLIKGFDANATVIDNDGDQLLVRTNADAPNFKLVSIDPKNPAKENWKTIIAESARQLQSVGIAGGKLLLTYLENASTKVYQCTYKGEIEREIQLPAIGTAYGFEGEKDDKELFYTFTSFNYPTSIYKYNITNGKSELFRKSEVKFKGDDYTIEQKFFSSKDGTKVPMFITYKKGLKLDGSNPVLLYGYGGFNVPFTPSFSISNAFFLEQGGVYVLVNLRGGSEYGEEWHTNGMLLKKQNVFDDFIAAAEFLIEKKYTSKNKLAIRGGSNGGLLIGACMTQRPDLFEVAIPEVGVLDMLRFNLFTGGSVWISEYGSVNNQTDFKNLYGYSPLHNLKKGTTYPSTLIITADHDDRVVPAHSFKFAATLQQCNDGKNPTLIRIEHNAGHGGGKPTSKQIEEVTDVWSFVMYNLGMEFK